MTTKSNDKPQKPTTGTEKPTKSASTKSSSGMDTVAQDASMNNFDATQNPQDIDAMIDWAAALQEQNAETAKSDTPTATNVVFPPLSAANAIQSSLNIEALKDVPVQITVELGRASLTVREVLQLGQGSVIELSSLAGEPLDILINGHLIAQGEVVVVGENYGVRLTDISSVSDRLSRYTKNS